MKKLFSLLFLALMTLPIMAQKNVYKFSVKDGNEHTVKLKDYKGKVLLIVNTATKCGFTPQYEALQKLYETYKNQGFVILDFPCNQFGAQAPGSSVTFTLSVQATMVRLSHSLQRLMSMVVTNHRFTLT